MLCVVSGLREKKAYRFTVSLSTRARGFPLWQGAHSGSEPLPRSESHLNLRKIRMDMESGQKRGCGAAKLASDEFAVGGRHGFRHFLPRHTVDAARACA